MPIKDRFDFNQPVTATSLHDLMKAQPNAQHFKRNCLDWVTVQLAVEEETDAEVEVEALASGGGDAGSEDELGL